MERRSTRLLVYVTSMLVFWTIAAPSAHAYIDPGSSSFIIQILIGAAAGAGLAIATFWRRIKLFFMKMFGKAPKQAESEARPETPPQTQPAPEPEGPDAANPPLG